MAEDKMDKFEDKKEEIKENVAEAVKEEREKEEEIVEKVAGKVSSEKESVEEGEKEIAAKIGKEEEKIDEVKEKALDKIEELDDEEDEFKTKEENAKIKEEEEKIKVEKENKGKNIESSTKESGDKSLSSKSESGKSSKDLKDIDSKDKKKGGGEKGKDDDKKKDKVSKRVGPRKTEAVVNGKDIRISTKHAVAICDFIRGKDIDKAIIRLGEVSGMKTAVPMKGEIPHRKGRIMSGRYPVKAAGEFIKLLNSLRANAIVNDLELEKFKIVCLSNVASRPFKRFGRGKAKRSHVQVKLVPRVKVGVRK